MKILIVIASVRNGRSGAKVADWFNDQVTKDGRFESEVVDLIDVNLPYELGQTLPSQIQNSEYEFEETRAWAKQVSDADAVVFVSPEYNHGYSASLKNAIDHLFAEWNNKPVGFVNYGSTGAPYSFVAISMVAQWVKMAVVQPRVAIPEIWAAFADDGTLAHADYHEFEAQRMLGALAEKVQSD
ncbi:NAD(P)H-dependent oxidoreductase [Candidatus Saccharibacteria bacterium]|nr:NAD(P)H-dependent oxidoreductase [Candidatus Saccharibacteria bacterium]